MITMACGQTRGEANRTTVIVNVNVIPMTISQQIRPAQTVVIRNERFVEIGSTGTVSLPKGAIRIDGTGRYLVPGFVDAHIHFQQNESSNLAFAQLFVANGITTVFNLYGSPMHLKLRDRIQRGETLGPRIFTSGPSLGTPHGRKPTETPGEIARAVADQKQQGYDFIKLHGDLLDETYTQLLASARDHKIAMIGHAPRNLGTKPMFRERQSAVAHMEEYLYAHLYFQRPMDSPSPLASLEPTIRSLAVATKDAGTAVISTLSVYRGIAEQIENLTQILRRPEVGYVPYAVGEEWGWWPSNNNYVRRFPKDKIPFFRAHYREQEQLALEFQKAGVLILAGTDAPTAAVVPGFSFHDELKSLVDAGLTPHEALKTATANPANFLGRLPDEGTIEEGKVADCVLLKGNPLESITNTRLIDGVCLRGRWISNAEITLMLNNIRRTVTKERRSH